MNIFSALPQLASSWPRGPREIQWVVCSYLHQVFMADPNIGWTCPLPDPLISSVAHDNIFSSIHISELDVNYKHVACVSAHSSTVVQKLRVWLCVIAQEMLHLGFTNHAVYQKVVCWIQLHQLWHNQQSCLSGLLKGCIWCLKTLCEHIIAQSSNKGMNEHTIARELLCNKCNFCFIIIYHHACTKSAKKEYISLWQKISNISQ